MTYNEIMNISDIEEKKEKLIEYYIKEIGVNDWLLETIEEQKIRFKDRWEYKKNGVFHRLTGPAIEFHNGARGFYYIDGVSMNEIEWKPLAQKLLREKKLKRTLNIKEE
jgi:hypothetical protein